MPENQDAFLDSLNKVKISIKVMMKCGHAANATDRNGNPCCAICAGLTPNAEIVDNTPDLTGRMSRCAECRSIVPSNTNLPFFEFRGKGSKYDLDIEGHLRDDVCKHGGLEFDSHYNGCRGWD